MWRTHWVLTDSGSALNIQSMRTTHNKTVPAALAQRKKRFRIALAVAGLTATEWAEENDVAPSYLFRYLGGNTVSEPLGKAIDAFTARHLKQLGRTA
jgi:hypothetical protein